MKNHIILMLAICAIWIIGCDSNKADKQTLYVNKVSTAPVIDGEGNEAIWGQAIGINVDLPELPYEIDKGELSINDASVEVKAVYNDKKVYFRFRWSDPTRSLARSPCVRRGGRDGLRPHRPSRPRLAPPKHGRREKLCRIGLEAGLGSVALRRGAGPERRRGLGIRLFRPAPLLGVAIEIWPRP